MVDGWNRNEQRNKRFVNRFENIYKKKLSLASAVGSIGEIRDSFIV